MGRPRIGVPGAREPYPAPRSRWRLTGRPKALLNPRVMHGCQDRPRGPALGRIPAAFAGGAVSDTPGDCTPALPGDPRQLLTAWLAAWPAAAQRPRHRAASVPATAPASASAAARAPAPTAAPVRARGRHAPVQSAPAPTARRRRDGTPRRGGSPRRGRPPPRPPVRIHDRRVFEVLVRRSSALPEERTAEGQQAAGESPRPRRKESRDPRRQRRRLRRGGADHRARRRRRRRRGGRLRPRPRRGGRRQGPLRAQGRAAAQRHRHHRLRLLAPGILRAHRLPPGAQGQRAHREAPGLGLCQPGEAPGPAHARHRGKCSPAAVRGGELRRPR